jgi:polysaccharide export outer membrane protein
MESPYYYIQQNDIIIIEPTKKKAAANDVVTTRNVTLALAFISTIAVLYSIFRNQ